MRARVLFALALVACTQSEPAPRRLPVVQTPTEPGASTRDGYRSPAEIREAGNHLVGEPSPYLLQHAHNPVDWYPFGEEALARARDLGRPIFLSIGYSTCTGAT